MRDVKPGLFLLFVTLIVSLAACDRSPEGSLTRAEEFRVKREFRSAIIELKALLQRQPKNAEARWALGQLYLEMENGASAEKELLQARLLGVVDDSTVPALAKAFMLQNKTDEVLGLKPVGQLSSLAKAEMDASRALALATMKQFEEAKAHMEIALENAPNALWVRLAHSHLLILVEEFDEAKMTLNSLLVDDPENGQAWSLLGAIHNKEEAYEEAEVAYTKAMEHRFASFSDQLQRGFARAWNGNLEGASQDAHQLLERSPVAHMAQYLLGLVYFQKGEYLDAVEALETAYGINDNYAPTVFLLATTQYRLGNIERAQNLAERAMHIAPNHMPTRKLLATMYLRQGNGAEAERVVKPVTDALVGDLEAQRLLANSLILQGKNEKAVEKLEDVAAASGDDPFDQLRAGIALFSRGQKDRGLEMLRRAIELAPDKQQTYTLLVDSFIKSKELDKALETAKKNLETNPEEPSAWNLLGVVYVAKADLEQAKQALMQALVHDPGHPVVSENLALLAAQGDDFAAARHYLEDALRTHPDNWRVLYRLSELELLEGNSVRAQGLLKRSIKVSPTALEPRIALARLYFSSNDPNSALELMSGVESSDVNVRLVRAEAFVELERSSEAKRILETLRDELPDNPVLYLLLARTYEQVGDKAARRAAVDRLFELAPGSSQAALLKARLLILENRIDEADKLLNNVGSQDHEHTLAYLGTRLALERRRGDTDAVLEIANTMFERQPSTATVTAVADALTRSGNTIEAKVQLENWIASRPQDWRATRMLSELYLASGKTAQAIPLLERLVDANPKDVSALNNLAWYSRDSNPTRALDFAEKAYLLSPDSPPVLDTYARLLASDGQSEKALYMIDRAVANAKGSSSTFKLSRAEINDINGNRKRAIEELKALISSEIPSPIRERARTLLEAWDG